MKKNSLLLVLHFILVPFILSIAGIFLSMTITFYGYILVLLVHLVGGAISGYFFEKKTQLKPLTSWKHFFIIYSPLFLTVFTATVLMLLTKGYFGNSLWNIFIYLEIPFFLNSALSSLNGQFLMIFFVPFTYFFTLLVGFYFPQRKSINLKSQFKSFLLALIPLIICITVNVLVLWERSQTILPSYGFNYANGYSDIDLQPYYVTNPKNILPTLNKKASFIVENPMDMPILDGAEAAYPVYAAFAKATYKNINKVNSMNSAYEIVDFTNTINGFERLMNGEVDIFFGAQPSKEQENMAKQAGKQVKLTPIGKEAFVFFVNKKNPVNNLDSQQIKDVYSGKITNWNQVGGEDNKIRAFQRPKNSGSQTIMEKFMGTTPLMEPLKEEISGMGEIMEQVANYRNYKNAIGYSFRFFATGMNPNHDIKLLSIHNVSPSAENIKNRKYPYVVNLYAISLQDTHKKMVEPFLKWMQGPQGQKLIKEVGYIPIH
ncbi:MAG: substrate-binding domain-containing protein [Bacillota bacterium]|nr:substrate-binding domain-containing protein [Bacillota bacterium]